QNDGTFDATSGGDISVTSFTFNYSNFTAPAGNITDSGSFIIDPGANFSANGGTLTMTGNGSLQGARLFNFIVDATSKTVTMAGTVTVDGDLTLTAGTLDATSADYIVITGNWINSAGTFVRGNCVVEFTGGVTHTLSGTQSFYIITIDSSDTLQLLTTLTV